MNLILKRPHLSAALFFLAGAVFLGSCEKPEEEIGLNLQPGEDILAISGVDTFTVKAITLREDSLRTDELDPALVGAYIDPIFGYARAGHATELRLSSGSPDFLPGATTLDEIEVDSVILSLVYRYRLEVDGSLTAVYGNTGPQEISVYELNERLYLDSVYYDNRPLNFINQNLVKDGFGTVSPEPFDTLNINGQILSPRIRLPLQESFVDRIFEASEAGGVDAEAFIELIKGLYITVDGRSGVNSQGGIIYFDSFAILGSRITMHYRNNNPEFQDTLRYDFELRGASGKYALFEHDYNLAAPELQAQLNGDFQSADQKLYLQAMGGTKVRVELPHLENLKDSTDLLVNKAELIIPVQRSRAYPIPSRLLIFGVEEDGRLYLLQDQADGRILGEFDEELGAYRFLITRHVQNILLGSRENTPLDIVVANAGSSANRAVINGPLFDPNDMRKNMRLAITFTKF